ncbi:hypothetical protein [Vibrio sp. TRT 1302]|uniref:hypothetical protein n=1 Tax=Vibrio sp. TRT 1302 TaxID=3418504 RepID=UPI003CF75A23
MRKLSLFSILLLLTVSTSFSALALEEGECIFTNLKLDYVGASFPGANDIYLDGDVLGTMYIKFDFECHASTYQGIIGTYGAGASYTGANRIYRSNIDGIILKSNFSVNKFGGQAGEFAIHNVGGGYQWGTSNIATFQVIKSGTISNASTSVNLNLEHPFRIASSVFWDLKPVYPHHSDMDSTDDIPVYNASCDITHPSIVEVPRLIPLQNNEVSSRFNIVLNCSNSSVMQNNIELTVNPVMTAGVTLSSDSQSLLYNSGGRIVSMNIFNSVGAETQMKFSTMYQFSNSSGGSSFTIPMRAHFSLGSGSGYGDYSFQALLSVQYN